MILLVGPEETPFGIQKDFLCSKSAYFQKYFAERPPSLENVVPLPDTPVDVFAHAQHFLYTGAVVPNGHEVPNYEVLIGLWTLGYSLGIDGLCDAALECMIEYRRITHTIPATPLLVRVWNETPEGSSIRKLLLSWAAEYMRSSDSRAEFARSLPQEVLSELVVAMSSLEESPAPPPPPPQPQQQSMEETAAAAVAIASAASAAARRSAASEPDGTNDADAGRPAKRRRGSDAATTTNGNNALVTTGRKRGPGTGAKPGPKPGSKRRSSAAVSGQQFSANQKLNFCADLLTRMLSGPGKLLRCCYTEIRNWNTD